MMESLNKYFLFEIRELLDNHIISNELKILNAKLEVRDSSVNSSNRSVDLLFPKSVMAEKNFAGNRFQIEMTIPRY